MSSMGSIKETIRAPLAGAMMAVIFSMPAISRVHADGKWHSGYLSPDGVFYGCWMLQHRILAEAIMQKMGYEGKDAQVILERLGWVSISEDRFLWDRLPNEVQKAAVEAYRRERGIAR